MKPKQERRELKRLYSRIPTFKCVSGCTDCCGPVPASLEERKHAPELLTPPETTGQIVDILQGCSSCPYVIENGGGCAIYDNRPFLCRLFGTVPGLPCPHGAGPGKMLSLAEERELMHDYYKLVAKA
jgi:uncharacterized protein